jgi:CrcB protein
MINVLLVGAGGFLGAVARYGMVTGVARLVSQPTFPWGVLAANVTGSLIIGVLAGLSESRNVFSAEVRLFLFIGLLGGFTTFSSITNDTLALVRESNYLSALGNVALSFVLGMAAVTVGYVLAKGS